MNNSNLTIPIIILICLLSLITNQTQSYKKLLPNIDPNAVCLDGSPAAIYQHIGTQPQKFLIFFGGGGSCGGITLSETIQNCYQRSKTYLGSSKYMLDELRPQGMLNTDINKSKFATWSKFIFAYCDGAFHQGKRDVPLSYKDTKLYVRGGAITKAHFKYIDQKYNLKNAKEIVISGVSAGAMAAFIWTNHLQSIVSRNTKVSTIIDSGIFFNDTSIMTGQPKSALMLQNIYKLANSNQNIPFSQCVTHFQPDQQYNCFFLQYSYPYIKGRIMNIGSMYDSYDLQYQYQTPCLVHGTQGQTFSNCSLVQNNTIQHRHIQTVQLTNKILLINQQNSAWVISCSNHVYVGNWKFYDSDNQTVNGVKVKEAVERFVFGKEVVREVDSVKWPMNKKCAY